LLGARGHCGAGAAGFAILILNPMNWIYFIF